VCRVFRLTKARGDGDAHRYDNGSHDRYPVGDPSKKAFTYFVLTGGRFVYAAAIRVTVLKFLMSMSVS
jgi:ubiquinol-cytochrome c reductase iron-sulfur subunit